MQAPPVGPRQVARPSPNLDRRRSTPAAAPVGRTHPVGEERADVRYTLNDSPHGSHRKIAALVPAAARVLDLGCSEGFLGQLLQGKAAGSSEPMFPKPAYFEQGVTTSR